MNARLSVLTYVPFLFIVFFLFSPAPALADNYKTVQTDNNQCSGTPIGSSYSEGGRSEGDFYVQPGQTPFYLYYDGGVSGSAPQPAAPAGFASNPTGYCWQATGVGHIHNNGDQAVDSTLTGQWYSGSGTTPHTNASGYVTGTITFQGGYCTVATPGQCTTAPAGWRGYAGKAWSGTQLASWPNTGSSCLTTCEASGAQYCNQTTVNNYTSNGAMTTTYSCSSIASSPVPSQVTRSASNTFYASGEPKQSTSFGAYNYVGAVTTCTQPTYTCTTFGASCSASPTSATTGQNVTWTAIVSPGGSYSYVWDGTDSLTGTAASVIKAYTAAGTKTANVTVSRAASGVYGWTHTGGGSASCPTSLPSCQNSFPTCSSSNANATYSCNGADYACPAGNPSRQIYQCSTNTESVVASCTVPVAAAQPDFSAEGVTPTTVTAGVPVNLSSFLTNYGSGGSGAVPYVIAINQNDTSDPNRIAHLWETGPATTAGGRYSITSAGTYTFPSAGTYYAIVCADFVSWWAGTIGESNENNNCGPWTAITVNPAVPAPPSGLTASCNAAGTQATISWTPTPGATYYYVRNDDGQNSTCGSWYCADPPDYIGETHGPLNGATSATITVVPGDGNNWWVHAGNSTGYSSPTSAWFTCAGQPDITQTAPTPTTANVGVSTAITGTISNIGNGTTGTTFPYWIVVRNGFGGSGSDLASFNPTNPIILAGGSNSVSQNVTFPSAGQYSAVLCTDYNSGWGSTVVESNEGNNCSVWTNITVTAPTPQCSDGIDNDGDGYTDYAGADPSCTSGGDTTEGPASPKANLSCTSPSPCTITPPASATLTYSGTNATSCTFADTGGVGTGPSTRSVSPAGPAPATYDLFCTNGSENSAHVTATVNVQTPTVYITATPARVNNGASVNVSWSGNLVTSCSMTKNGTSFTPPAPGNLTPSGNVLATSTIAQTITNQTIYKLTCNGKTSTAVVNVNGGENEF